MRPVGWSNCKSLNVNKPYDWSYQSYLNSLDTTEAATFSLNPTTINSGTAYFYRYEFCALSVRNKIIVSGITTDGKYEILHIDTNRNEIIDLPFFINNFDNIHIFCTIDNGIVILNGTDVYLASDYTCKDIQLIASANGLTTSSFNTQWCKDYTGKYVYLWYSETSKIARADLQTHDVSYFTLSGVGWLCKGMILPDDSFMATTVDQKVKCYSGDSFQVKKYEQTHGSYAGYTNRLTLIGDECASFGVGSRSYYNYWNTDNGHPVKTSGINLWSQEISNGSQCLPIKGKSICYSRTTASGLPKSKCWYIVDLYEGTFTEIHNDFLDQIYDIDVEDHSFLLLPNGNLMVLNYNTHLVKQVDFNFSKIISESAYTSPWFNPIALIK